MKRKLLYLVSLLSLVCIQSVKGQKLDEILWPKHSSKLADFVTSQDDIKNGKIKYVLLFNRSAAQNGVGRNNAFLTNGGNYSMKGILSNIGNRFYITEQVDGRHGATKNYNIHSNIKNLAEKGLGNCVSINLDEESREAIIGDSIFAYKITGNRDCVYMDRGGSYKPWGQADAGAPNWIFTPKTNTATDENGMQYTYTSYTISNYDVKEDADGTIKGDHWGYSDRGSKNVFLNYDLNENKIKFNTKQEDEWCIILETEYSQAVRGMLENSYTDVSGIVRDGGFNRFNTFATEWVALGKDGNPVVKDPNDDQALNLGKIITGPQKNENYVNSFVYNKADEVQTEATVKKNVKELLAYRSHIIGAERLEQKIYQRYNVWDTYRFLGGGDGAYKITVDDKGMLTATHAGDVYVSGSLKTLSKDARDIGKDDKTGWPDPTNIPCVSEGKYQLTLTAGKNLNANELNIKFVSSKEWGKLSVSLTDKAAEYLMISEVDGMVGNIQYKEGKSLTPNKDYTFTLTKTGESSYNLDFQEALNEEAKDDPDNNIFKIGEENTYTYKHNCLYIPSDANSFEKVDPFYFKKQNETASDAMWKDWNETKRPWEFWKEYGKDFSAGIYSQGSYKQTIKNLPKGTYHVRCTAFNSGTNPEFGKMKVNGKEILLPLLKDKKEAFEDKKRSMKEEAKKHLWLEDAYDYQGLDVIAAAKLLEENKDLFTVEISVKLETDGSTLEIGFGNENTDETGAFNYPVFADNFQVFYDNIEYVTYISANNADVEKIDKYAYEQPVELYVRRAFTKGKWNSIVLPFDIEEENVTTAFGNGARLSKLEGINPERPTQIKFNYTSTLKAGECGLIWIPESAVAVCETSSDSKDFKVLKEAITSTTPKKEIAGKLTDVRYYGPLYNFGNVTRPDNNGDGLVEFSSIVSKNYTTAPGTLEYEGYYCKPKNGQNNEMWPGGSYIVYDGDMYHLSSDWGVKYATMWYLKDHQDTSLSRTFVINGIADNTVTEISGVVIDNGMAETGRIYNLNGQYMGDNASKDNLPKGLYIMNGKKFIVR